MNKVHWTKAQDEILLRAIEKHNLKYPHKPIPEDPHSNKAVCFALVKREFLQDFPKSPRQMRDRYVENLSPKIQKNMSEYEKEMILELYNERGRCWTKISKYIHENYLKKEKYYSPNHIKSICLREDRIRAKKEQTRISFKENNIPTYPHLANSVTGFSTPPSSPKNMVCPGTGSSIIIDLSIFD